MSTDSSRQERVGVIALVPDQWGPPWSVRHHVVWRLAQHFTTVWVNPAPTWREAWSGAQSMSGPPAADYGAGSRLLIYRPSGWLPRLHRPAVLARLTEWLRLRRARRLLQAAGCNRFVLYIWRPELGAALDLVAHDVSCYHIDDEYTFSETEKPIPEAELRLLRRADLVIVHSTALMQKKGSVNPHTVQIPNGVDYRAYSTPAACPADLATIARPRIGYIGVIKTHLDLDLLRDLAQRHSNWSIVLVGPVGYLGSRAELYRRLCEMPNVHALGAKPLQLLPAYIQHMDVCMLCYRLNDYTRYIYPVKLHEYLATGRPVVGSSIQALQAFRDVISIAETPAEWSQAIEQALAGADRDAEQSMQRQEVAAAHDWNQLVARIAQSFTERIESGRRHRTREGAPATTTAGQGA